MNRPTLTLPLVAGVALTALLGGAAAWSATGSTAVLSVDGQSREVDFRGRTASDVVEAAGLVVGEHDRLVPGADTKVEDGETISLRRGRELELVVDGQPQRVWVTAGSVDEALQQVGLRQSGLALSASRSRSIPLEGLRLAVTTPKAISIVADGRTVPRSTTAATVRAALVEARIALDGDDRISVDGARPVSQGQVIRVVRVRTARAAEVVATPFATVRRQDAALVRGTTRTVTEGRTGRSRRIIQTAYADAQPGKRTLVGTEVVTRPVTRVLAIGTGVRAAPAPARPSAPAPVRQQAASAPRQSTGGGGSLNWAALAQCESGGNPAATNATGKYRGLYQFSFATWQGVGGSGDPAAASSGEQTYRATLLYNRSGAGQWPECGSRLFS